MFITAKKLWYDGELATGMCEAPFNCDLMVGATPRDAYIVPAGGNCGKPFYNGPLFSAPNPYPANTIQGVWLEFRGGKGMFIDALSAQTVIDACDGCCGNSPVIAGRYNGVLPQPQPPVAATYTFTRADAGDWYAQSIASQDYWPSYIANTFMFTGHNAGTGLSTYQFQAYQDPVYIAGDTQTAETPRVYNSNDLTPLPAGQQYVLMASVNGQIIYPQITAASLAALVTAANGNTKYSTYGTWSTTGNHMVLTTSNATNVALLLTSAAPTVYLSNDAPTLSGSNVLNATVIAYGQQLTPILTGANVAALVTAANGNAAYSALGVWAASGTKLQLTSYVNPSASIVLGQQAP